MINYLGKEAALCLNHLKGEEHGMFNAVELAIIEEFTYHELCVIVWRLWW